MKTYKVFERGGQKVAVKQGWSWPGFFFHFIWAFTKKLIMLGVIILVAALVVGVVNEVLLPDKNLVSPLGLIVGIVCGIKGNKWWEGQLQRSGYSLVGTVQAKSPAAAASSTSLQSQPDTEQGEVKKPALNAKTAWRACLGVIVLLAIIGAIGGGPSTKIEGDTAKVHHKAKVIYSASIEGGNVARVIWKTAKNHPDIKKIEVTVELTGDKMIDTYGKEVEGPHIMGSIVVTDLNEVRKYESEDAYWFSIRRFYSLQIRDMKYGHLFQGKEAY